MGDNDRIEPVVISAAALNAAWAWADAELRRARAAPVAPPEAVEVPGVIGPCVRGGDDVTKQEMVMHLEALAKAVPYASAWRHYKGGKYVVRGHCIREHDCEPCVLYSNRADGRLIFCRPAAEWLGAVRTEAGEVARYAREESQ